MTLTKLPVGKFLRSVIMGIILAFIALPALITMLFSQSSKDAQTTFKVACVIVYGAIACALYYHYFN